MKVFRVEDPNGKGPYSSSMTNEILYNKLSSKNESRPSPKRDGIEIRPGIDVCGFDSIEKLKQWFHGCRSDLRKAGFYVAIYEVDAKEIKFGRRQVIFPKSTNRLEICSIP